MVRAMRLFCNFSREPRDQCNVMCTEEGVSVSILIDCLHYSDRYLAKSE